jgi:Mg/Co/Ni transporter MgtE
MSTLLAANLVNPALGPQLQALNGVTFIQKLVPAAILMGLTIGVIIFFINFLTGGVAYINSGGDKGKTEAARSKITNALIGIVVLFTIFAVLTIVGNFLGTDLTLLNLDSLRIQ